MIERRFKTTGLVFTEIILLVLVLLLAAVVAEALTGFDVREVLR